MHGIIRRVIQAEKSCKAVKKKDSRKSKNTFGYLVITRIIRDGSKNGEGTQLSIRIQQC